VCTETKGKNKESTKISSEAERSSAALSLFTQQFYVETTAAR